MKKLLSNKFYENLKNEVLKGLENKSNKRILEKVDWENEGNHYLSSLIAFFGKIDLKKLQYNAINSIGVVDICWNEYGSDIEIDFMPDNNFETAFNDGCIMNNSAVDNDAFFKNYFKVDNDKSWEEIGNDYHKIILAFYYLIEDIIEFVVAQKEFKILPKKSPCHIAFAFFHDEEREKIYTLK